MRGRSCARTDSRARLVSAPVFRPRHVISGARTSRGREPHSFGNRASWHFEKKRIYQRPEILMHMMPRLWPAYSADGVRIVPRRAMELIMIDAF